MDQRNVVYYSSNYPHNIKDTFIEHLLQRVHVTPETHSSSHFIYTSSRWMEVTESSATQ